MNSAVGKSGLLQVCSVTNLLSGFFLWAWLLVLLDFVLDCPLHTLNAIACLLGLKFSLVQSPIISTYSRNSHNHILHSFLGATVLWSLLDGRDLDYEFMWSSVLTQPPLIPRRFLKGTILTCFSESIQILSWCSSGSETKLYAPPLSQSFYLGSLLWTSFYGQCLDLVSLFSWKRNKITVFVNTGGDCT